MFNHQIITILSSLTYTSFWVGSISLFSVFFVIVSIFGIPVYFYLNRSQTPLSITWLPVIGFVNLNFILQASITANLFTYPQPPPIIFITTAGLLLEFLVIILIKSFSGYIKIKSEEILRSLKPLMPALIIYFLLFLIISASWFDSQTQTFFTPGYDVNHDSLTLSASIRHLIQPLNRIENVSSLQAAKVYFKYPLGGTFLQAIFSLILAQDTFHLYPRVILLSLLILVFPILEYFLTYSKLVTLRIFPYVAVSLTIFNYLNLSFLNTSVLGSTLMLVPYIATVIAILLWLKRQLNTFQLLGLTFLCLSTAFSLYTYVTLLYLNIFIACLFFFYPVKRLLLILTITCFSAIICLTSPPNFINTADRLHMQLTTDVTEESLFGAKGNTASYLNPLQSLSFWISHPNYLQANSRVRNSWLGFGIAILFVVLACVKPPAYFNHDSVRNSLALSLNIVILIGLTFITASSYSNSKVMHHLAVLWPVILYGITLPYLTVSSTITPLIRLILWIIIIVSLISGLNAYRYVPRPLVSDSLELDKLANVLCRDPKPLLILGRNEWARYFLSNCHHAVNYFDRTVSWRAVVTTTRTNRLNSLIDPCLPQTLTLPPLTPQNYDRVLIDNCFNTHHLPYQSVESWDHYTLYQHLP